MKIHHKHNRCKGGFNIHPIRPAVLDSGMENPQNSAMKHSGSEELTFRAKSVEVRLAFLSRSIIPLSFTVYFALEPAKLDDSSARKEEKDSFFVFTAHRRDRRR